MPLCNLHYHFSIVRDLGRVFPACGKCHNEKIWIKLCLHFWLIPSKRFLKAEIIVWRTWIFFLLLDSYCQTAVQKTETIHRSASSRRKWFSFQIFTIMHFRLLKIFVNVQTNTLFDSLSLLEYFCTLVSDMYFPLFCTISFLLNVYCSLDFRTSYNPLYLSGNSLYIRMLNLPYSSYNYFVACLPFSICFDFEKF
jgi:hypothetical protein